MAHRNVLFRGFSDIDQIHTIFRLLGTPTAEEWPGLEAVPYWRGTYPCWPARHMHAFLPRMGTDGIDFMSKILCYDPKLRMSARAALQHPFISGADEPPVTPRTPVHCFVANSSASSASVTRVVSQESCADLQALELMAGQQGNLLHRAPPMSRCSSVLEGAVVTAMDDAAGVTSAAGATFQPICSSGPSGARPSGAQAATLAAQTGTALTVPAAAAATAIAATVPLALPQPNRASKGQIVLSNPRVVVPVVPVAELNQPSQSVVAAVVTQSSQGESQGSSASTERSVPSLEQPATEMLSEEHVKLATQRSAYQAIFASQQQVAKPTAPVRASRSRSSTLDGTAVAPAAAAAKRKAEGVAAVLMEPRPRSRLGKTMNFASPDAVTTTNTTAAPSVEAVGASAAAFVSESSAAGGVWGPPPTKKMRSSKQQQQKQQLSAVEAGRSVSRLRVGSEDSQTSGMSFVSSLDLDLESSMEVSEVSMDAGGVAGTVESVDAVAVPDPSSALQQPTGTGKTRFYKRKFGAVSSSTATAAATLTTTTATNPIGASSVPRAPRSSTTVFVRVTPEAATTTSSGSGNSPANKTELYWTGSTPDFLASGAEGSEEGVKVPVVGGSLVTSDIKDDAKQGRSNKSSGAGRGKGKGKDDKTGIAEAAVAVVATAPVTRRSARIVR